MAIQVALGAILISGVVVASLAYSSYLPMISGYYGIGGSVVSGIALVVFRSYSSSKLDRMIDSCTSFAEIKEILAQSEMRISFFGTRHILTDSGEKSTLDHLATKVEKLIASHLMDEPVRHTMSTGKTFVYNDKNERLIGNDLAKHISSLFSASEREIDKKNIISRIIYYVPKFFREMICYNDIRARYDGNFGIHGSTIWGVDENYSSSPGRDEMPPHWGMIY